LGNNGDGKTTLLQAIAGCLMDATTADRMLNLSYGVRNGQKMARMTATVIQQDGDKQNGRPPKENKPDRTIQYLIVNGSDGYRSMFALAVDLLRWLTILRPNNSCKLNEVNGVVLIDEIDWLQPQMATRSRLFVHQSLSSHPIYRSDEPRPFVAMAAGEGALTLLERDGHVVSAKQDLPYVRGWAIDQLLTQLFGMINLRDPETTRKLERYESWPPTVEENTPFAA